jgi:hypothetical protein
MSARRGDFHGAFDMLLTFDLAEIKVLFCGSNVGPAVERGHRLQSDISAQKMDDLRKGTRSVDVDTFHHRGFRGILERHDQSLSAPALRFQGYHFSLSIDPAWETVRAPGRELFLSWNGRARHSLFGGPSIGTPPNSLGRVSQEELADIDGRGRNRNAGADEAVLTVAAKLSVVP